MNRKIFESLRQFRINNKLTQQEIADKIGVRRVKYTKVELGYIEPDLAFVRAFQRAFNLPAGEIERIFLYPECSDAETQKVI